MKQKVKLGKTIDILGPNRYTIFYDVKTLAEIYCFLFSEGYYLIQTETGKTMMGDYNPSVDDFATVLAVNGMILG